MIRIQFDKRDGKETLSYLNLDNLKTGDVFCVAYSISPMSPLIYGLTGSKWTHAALCYVDPHNGMPYILEGAYYKHRNETFFFKMPFMTWYRINRYNLIGYKPINREVDAVKFYNVFEKFINNSYLDSFGTHWLRFLRTDKHIPYTTDEHYKRRFTCVEVAIRTLQDSGVLDPSKNENSYLLGDLLNDRIPTVNGYTYGGTQVLCPGRAWVRGIVP